MASQFAGRSCVRGRGPPARRRESVPQAPGLLWGLQQPDALGDDVAIVRGAGQLQIAREGADRFGSLSCLCVGQTEPSIASRILPVEMNGLPVRFDGGCRLSGEELGVALLIGRPRTRGRVVPRR